jgi:hypothetical protein
VTLSLGERPDGDLAAWREAGADRYLLRFETSNRALYEHIHPPLGGRPSDRIALLRRLRGLGYEIGGYTEAGDAQVMEREQFQLGDVRPLDTVMRELIEDGYIPSFCTSCYRLGRTGEHFMEFAIPGFIKRFCTPNALLTLQEYLADYASPATLAAGEKTIAEELAKLEDGPQKAERVRRLEAIRTAEERDLYF